MDIKKHPIKFNFSSRGGQRIQYIVIHDTGNTRIGADAMAHFNYFNGGNRQASAHYFVDDKQVVQLVEDRLSAWHVGDGKGKYGITNANSLGIEVCVNNDGDYKKAVAKTIELTAYLMKLHNLPLDKVIRHYDASRKLCPMSMSSNNWADWRKFKKDLEDFINRGNQQNDKVRINVLGRLTEVDGYLQNGTNFIKVNTSKGVQHIPIRELAASLGLIVDWDNTNRIVILK